MSMTVVVLTSFSRGSDMFNDRNSNFRGGSSSSGASESNRHEIKDSEFQKEVDDKKNGDHFKLLTELFRSISERLFHDSKNPDQPHDEEVSALNIDRAATGTTVPSLQERIAKTAKSVRDKIGKVKEQVLDVKTKFKGKRNLSKHLW